MSEELKVLYAFLIALIAAPCLIGLIVFMENLRSFPGEKAEIDRLREDYLKVPKDSRSQIISDVALENKTIACWKKYRSLWWSQWFIHPGWDNVEYIDIA